MPGATFVTVTLRVRNADSNENNNEQDNSENDLEPASATLCLLPGPFLFQGLFPCLPLCFFNLLLLLLILFQTGFFCRLFLVQAFFPGLFFCQLQLPLSRLFLFLTLLPGLFRGPFIIT